MADLKDAVYTALGAPPPPGHEITVVAPVSSRPPLALPTVLAVVVCAGIGGAVGGVLGATIGGGLGGGLGAVISSALGSQGSSGDRPKRTRAEQQDLARARRELGVRDQMVWAVNSQNLLILETSSFGPKQPRRLCGRIPRREVTIESVDGRHLVARIKGLPVEVWGTPAHVQALASELGGGRGAAGGVAGASASGAASGSDGPRTAVVAGLVALVVLVVLVGIVVVLRRPSETSAAGASSSSSVATTTTLATTTTVPHVTRADLAGLCSGGRASPLAAPYQPGPGPHPIQIWEDVGYPPMRPYDIDPKMMIWADVPGPELDKVQLVGCLTQHPVEKAFECGPYGDQRTMWQVGRRSVDLTVYAASTGAVVAQQTMDLVTVPSCPDVVGICASCPQTPAPPDVRKALETYLTPYVLTP